MSSTNPDNTIQEYPQYEEKNRLFDEIQRHLELPRADLYVSDIQDKIAEYNAIRDQEDEIIPKRGSDPANVFPPEIWREILRECTASYSTETDINAWRQNFKLLICPGHPTL